MLINSMMEQNEIDDIYANIDIRSSTDNMIVRLSSLTSLSTYTNQI